MILHNTHTTVNEVLDTIYCIFVFLNKDSWTRNRRKMTLKVNLGLEQGIPYRQSINKSICQSIKLDYDVWDEKRQMFCTKQYPHWNYQPHQIDTIKKSRLKIIFFFLGICKKAYYNSYHPCCDMRLIKREKSKLVSPPPQSSSRLIALASN